MGGKIFRSGSLVSNKCFGICGFPIGPAGSQFSGNLKAIWRPLEVAKKFHMGLAGRKFGP